MVKILNLVGCASGTAGADPHSGDGPTVIQGSPYLSTLAQQGLSIQWHSMIRSTTADTSLRIDEAVREVCEKLAKATSELTRQKKFFSVIGGDHSCAIGTWSGVYDALHEQGDFGLIWIDAHMDSHTPETSPSGRIHGMPVACLLGYGYNTLTSILNYSPKLKPEHLCIIGVRSFEAGEAALLKRLNVRVYFMEEVKQRGFATVLNEAIELVNRNTVGYGITLDLDSIDPIEAPGVDVPEKDGIHVAELQKGLSAMAGDSRLIATEIVEFDPSHDENNKTEKLVVALLGSIAQNHWD